MRFGVWNLLMRPKLYRHLLLRFIFFIHRKVEKRAEKSHFMFAVDPPKTLADRKDGKHKGQFASNKKKA
jgi:hypothetical protein